MISAPVNSTHPETLGLLARPYQPNLGCEWANQLKLNIFFLLFFYKNLVKSQRAEDRGGN